MDDPTTVSPLMPMAYRRGGMKLDDEDIIMHVISDSDIIVISTSAAIDDVDDGPLMIDVFSSSRDGGGGGGGGVGVNGMDEEGLSREVVSMGTE
jgi:hypothetical protein